MRLAVVSDSHLSPELPAADRNWEVALDHVDRLRPALVVHGGDVSANGSVDRTDLEHAHRLTARLSVPWRVVPGNHDLGNPDDERDVAMKRRHCYEQVFGDRFWCLELDGWRLVGLDCQALVADHPDDGDDWAWVAGNLVGHQPTVVFQHRPLAPTSAAEIDTPKRYHPEPVRSRLGELLSRSAVRAVVSGHVHQWRDETIDGIRFIWAPSTWGHLPDEKQPVIGTKTVGMVELELGPGGAVDARVVTGGFEQGILGVTTPTPAGYRRLSRPGRHR